MFNKNQSNFHPFYPNILTPSVPEGTQLKTTNSIFEDADSLFKMCVEESANGGTKDFHTFNSSLNIRMSGRGDNTNFGVSGLGGSNHKSAASANENISFNATEFSNHNYNDDDKGVENYSNSNTNSSNAGASPFMIVKTNTVRNNLSTQTSKFANKGLSPSFNSPSYKTYTTPSPNLKEKLSDRFIPCRGVNLIKRFEMTKALSNNDEEISEELSCEDGGDDNMRMEKTEQSSQSVKNYNNLLKTNFFGDENDIFNVDKFGGNSSHPSNNLEYSKLFQFKEKKKTIENKIPFTAKLNSYNKDSVLQVDEYRKFPRLPYKILDAPGLLDDFYLNLIDWSPDNDLVVGLHNRVYIWSATRSNVTQLAEYSEENYVSSVICYPKGKYVGIGTSFGKLDIVDVETKKQIRSLDGHTNRIGVIAWGNSLIATGSKDYSILIRDLRVNQDFVNVYVGHKQEVCGLKWNGDESQLASGGNDNKLFIWNSYNNKPLAKFSNHTAAVKAIAWSPHQGGLLASGGGTADRTIRFWNTNTLQQVNYIDTGSQVCNLTFSKNVNELVSTHGFSLNQIIVWKLPEMKKMTTLTGHSYRVLYLSMSPDGQNIVTGAGDETLRFWNLFPGFKTRDSDNSSVLSLNNSSMR